MNNTGTTTIQFSLAISLDDEDCFSVEVTDDAGAQAVAYASTLHGAVINAIEEWLENLSLQSLLTRPNG